MMGLGHADAEGGEERKLRMSARMAVESLKGLYFAPVDFDLEPYFHFISRSCTNE